MLSPSPLPGEWQETGLRGLGLSEKGSIMRFTLTS